MADNSWLGSHVTFPCPFLCFAHRCCQHCDFHNWDKNTKIFKGIKILLKGVIPGIRCSRARFEAEKPYFDATPHYRFGSLEYDGIVRMHGCEKKKPSKLTCNSLMQVWCEGSGNSQHAHVPKWEFLEFFSFRSFLFIFPVSIPTSMTGKPNRGLLPNGVGCYLPCYLPGKSRHQSIWPFAHVDLLHLFW